VKYPLKSPSVSIHLTAPQEPDSLLLKAKVLTPESLSVEEIVAEWLEPNTLKISLAQPIFVGSCKVIIVKAAMSSGSFCAVLTPSTLCGVQTGNGADIDFLKAPTDGTTPFILQNSPSASPQSSSGGICGSLRNSQQTSNSFALGLAIFLMLFGLYRRFASGNS
jgi:hypothetical protein